MALQSSGPITARQIARELGYTTGAATSIGQYRLNGGQIFTDGVISTIGDFANDELDCDSGISTCIRRKIGLYQNIGIGTNSDATTTGEGSGMVFEVVIGDDSGRTGNPFDDFGTLVRVNIINGGVGNRVGDIIQINDRWIGNTGQVPMTFKVESLTTDGVALPVSEGVPTSGPIKFSDFYEARRTFVVDYFSKDENRPQDAYDRFIGVGNTVAIGGFSTLDANAGTSGQRVIILVNKDITSSKGNVNNCALRTGTGWDPDTVLEINVGPDGEVLGAGGDGGRGGESDRGNGFVGGDGSSAIGIQHEGTGGTKVTIQSGGRVAAGGGGGGGGGGAFVEREERWGGPRRYAGGSGGGGGVGSPAGLGGGGGGNGGRAGTSGSKTTSGVGGPFNTQGGEYVARGGKGGDGGGISGTSVNDGIDGADGLGYGRIEGSPRHTGGKGAGGDAGAAIRRNVGLTVVIQNLGPPSQLLGSTSATGIA